jgi:uncharacterized protein YjbI with pentapeptide repeats
MDNLFKIFHVDALIQQWAQFEPDIKIALLISFFGTLLGFKFTSYLIVQTKYWQERKAKKILSHSFGSELFGPDEITHSTRYYIDPAYSEINPSENKEPGKRKKTKQKLLEVLDKILSDTYKPAGNKSVKKIRHVLILADSGMGKTSFLLNYYAQNQMKSTKKRHRLALVPLGIPNADEYIDKIDKKRDTILLLDGFDEYTKAERDQKEKLDELLFKYATFKKLVLTCRTKFFLKNADIPKKTRFRILLSRIFGEKEKWEYWRLYLCAFNDKQIKKYFIRRYRWKFKFRKDALTLVKKLPMLAVRPMILAYIQDLIDEAQQVDSTFQLYDIMVQKWLERESSWIDKHSLFSFSKELAGDIFVNRRKRGMEKLPPGDLNQLVKKIGLSQEQKWKFAHRSLLNRDGLGNFKFTHRSIMEFLFVYRFLELNPGDRPKTIFTDMMQQFVLEAIEERKFKGNENKEFCRVFLNEADLASKNLNDFNFSEANLQGADLRGTNLVKADLRGANLVKADLRRANLAKADLRRANLEGVNLEGANLQGANLEETNLVAIRLQGADLGEANLHRANLQGANLQGFNFQRVNLVEANLQGVDLRGANLVEANLQGVDLRSANLVGTKLQGTDLRRANLEGVNLEGANLQGANLEETNLVAIRLQGADLGEANLHRANLQGASLQGFSFQRVNLQGANLQGVDLRGANLEGANLQEAELVKANFQGANLVVVRLRGANLVGAKLQGADLRRANLEGANLEGADLGKANFQGADLGEVNLHGADLQGANLGGVNLQGANLQGLNFQRVNLVKTKLQTADLQGANLVKANLQEADLQGAKLRGANLAEANLQGADLQEADLQGARLRGANLDGAKLQGTHLQGTNLVGANLVGANLQGADLEAANLEGANLEGANLEGANLQHAIYTPPK